MSLPRKTSLFGKASIFTKLLLSVRKPLPEMYLRGGRRPLPEWCLDTLQSNCPLFSLPGTVLGTPARVNVLLRMEGNGEVRQRMSNYDSGTPTPSVMHLAVAVTITLRYQDPYSRLYIFSLHCPISPHDSGMPTTSVTKLVIALS